MQRSTCISIVLRYAAESAYAATSEVQKLAPDEHQLRLLRNLVLHEQRPNTLRNLGCSTDEIST